MKIIINDSRKLFTIQEDFNAMFPYLRLEFFSKPLKPASPSFKNQLKANNSTLAECRTVNTEGTIVITPAITVAQLDHDFKTIFGLGVRVFRKSGKVWLETTVTDGWTLKEQNEQGEALSNPVK